MLLCVVSTYVGFEFSLITKTFDGSCWWLRLHSIWPNFLIPFNRRHIVLMNELSCAYCYDNGKIWEIAFGLTESELTRDGCYFKVCGCQGIIDCKFFKVFEITENFERTEINGSQNLELKKRQNQRFFKNSNNCTTLVYMCLIPARNQPCILIPKPSSYESSKKIQVPIGMFKSWYLLNTSSTAAS
jgi:hypothetical protein